MGIHKLSDIPRNQLRRITRLEGPIDSCARLLDIGLTPGEEVVVTHMAPLGDPIIVLVRGARLALRRREASWIWVQ